MTMQSPMTGAHPPGRLWYAVAVVVLLAGWAGMVLLLYAGLSGMDERMIRVLVPGQTEFTLRQPGVYTIFHEYRSTFEGRTYDVDRLSGLHITVRPKAGGDPLKLAAATTGRYTLWGNSGRSLFSFDVRGPGGYVINGSYLDGRKTPETVLAIDHGFVGNLLRMISGALVCGLGGSAIAGSIAFIVRRKRKAAAAGGRV